MPNLARLYLTLARFLQDLAHARKVDVNVHFLARILNLAGSCETDLAGSCKTVLAGYVFSHHKTE